MQVKFAYVTCSLKPLAFFTHRNFRNIHKRPINSSRGKMLGKIMILIPKVFLRPLNSFKIIFRQETSTSLQRKPRERKSQKRFSRQVLVCLFLSAKILCLWPKAPNEQGICCSFIRSWHRGSQVLGASPKC